MPEYKRLRELREDRDLTQTYIANILHVNQKHIQDMKQVNMPYRWSSCVELQISTELIRIIY